MRFAAFNYVALIAVGVPGGAVAQLAAPLPVEAALAQPSFSPYAPVVLSPDGAWVAYVLQYPNRANRAMIDAAFTPTGAPSTASGARLRITELRTGRTLTVGNESATNWDPAWSPDGRYLAYYSDADGLAHLWVREMATGRARRVSDAIVRAHRALQFPRWTPDSRGLVIPALPAGSPLPEAALEKATRAGEPARDTDTATVKVFRADPAFPYGGQIKHTTAFDALGSLLSDLVHVELASGKVRTLAHDIWPNEFTVAPNGRFVAIESEKTSILRPQVAWPYDVMVVALGEAGPGSPRMIARDAILSMYEGRNLLWSPDGGSLLYSVTDSGGRQHYFSVDSTSWRPQEVAPSAPSQTEPRALGNMAQSVWWDDDGRAFYALSLHRVATVSMPEGTVRSVAHLPAGYEVVSMVGSPTRRAVRTDGGRSLVLVVRNDSTKRMGFARLDLATGSWRMIREEDRFYGVRPSIAMDVSREGRVAFLSEDSHHPTDVWTAPADLSTVRQVTHVAPEMERFTLGTTRLIDYMTPNGPRRGTLLLPVGYRSGTRYPLVVYPYPSLKRSDDVNVFGVTGTGVENMQLLATRGFAVLAPDMPPFDWKEEMRELPAIITAGVDRVIALGIADSARVGIIGQSWGGYTVIATIAMTQRFAAAVSRGGMSDLVAMTGMLQATGYAYGVQLQEWKTGGTLWERPEIYRRNSPIYFLDQVHTPLLIIHGEAETTVPVYLADQTFANLQRLGREVELAKYAHENHFEGRWSHANQRDYLERMISWFESHLKPEQGTNRTTSGAR